jgi:hypothetical protein
MSMIGREKNGRITFDYRCECADCDEAGRLVLVAAEQGTVACPGGCGAAYVPWKNPLNGHRWELKNVIMPHYGSPELGDYVTTDDDDGT